ncbi:hypothetical protein KC330_g3450 [Hortaea werneckii]|nr:hypothetical protein KC330_g3450 [Hortaea werneckii]
MILRHTAPFVACGMTVAGQGFSSSNWNGQLDSGSGVLRSLQSSLDPSFDFSPTDVFDQRNGPGNYHTGDLTMRWRFDGSDEWEEVNTAAHRAIDPSTIDSSEALHKSDFGNVFPDLAGTMSIVREWSIQDEDLVLKATIRNEHDERPIEIGAFGFPIEFNSILTGRTPVETTDTCVFMDPYVGLDAGYVRVTRLTGTGPNMVVTPYGKDSKFEAWRFLDEAGGAPLQYQSHTFEGFFSWQTLTKAYAENEWNATEQWNEPTSITLQAGQNITFGLRFTATPSVESIESTVSAIGLPVAVGVPGLVIPSDLDAMLYLNSKSKVKSITAEPTGALSFQQVTVPNSSWEAYTIGTSSARERVRVNLQYADGMVQTVHCFITDPAPEVFARHGRFLFSEQYFEGDDTFNRTPSVITYDYEARKQVQQEHRVWIAGLQDEGGAASWVAAAMKTAYLPIKDEVRKLEDVAAMTIWQHMQYTTDVDAYPKYSVKRSQFFWEPEAVPGFQYDPSITYGGWSSWNRSEVNMVWRPYNYVWVSLLHWSLYRAEKLLPGTLVHHNASWYLETAVHTIETCWSTLPNGDPLVRYGEVGLMGETIWLEILADLQAEGMNASYESIRSIMEGRQKHWASVPDPFGSEAPWDSTGQEAVYLWSQYFDDSKLADKTLASIRGYMPTIAHWAYNGNARRWWDFDVAGKLSRIERQIHHYASPLNAVPLLDSYTRSAGASFYDLRVGYAGWSGALSNINRDGFGSQAFHAWPQTLAWDGYSSDYGAGLSGHMVYSMCVLVDDPDFGLVAMMGNIKDRQSTGVTHVVPRDTVRRRVYVAPVGLQVRASAGEISSFSYDRQTGAVIVDFDKSSQCELDEITVEWYDLHGTGIAPSSASSEGNEISVSLPGRLQFLLEK